MSTPPEHNILLDPITELRLALAAHAFGVDPQSDVLLAQSFPRSDEDKAAVRAAADAGAPAPERVVARARVVFLQDEGEAVVALSSAGYVVESWTLAAPLPAPFESLDALLIAASPAYVAAMQDELHKRFAGDSVSRRFVYDDDDDGQDEPAWID
ncbi:hypothetical protein VHUM_00723 [Vanrija humicola]|uniref:GSKIP domain-containing protein n=1 Tax=Vanrija humicola TaxID=5417 RepID=A0A7D8Z8U8_VANHU|nr:hypothetical protein VHUM_00723 [Vanrija humicola]